MSYKNKADHVAWVADNIGRVRAGQRAWYVRNRDAILAKGRAWRKADNPAYLEKRLQYDYGIGVAEYNAMLEAQGGTCAICGMANPDGRRLVVDHCHNSSAVRGLLCTKHNRALGLFGDDPALLRAALKYLSDE